MTKNIICNDDGANFGLEKEQFRLKTYLTFEKQFSRLQTFSNNISFCEAKPHCPAS